MVGFMCEPLLKLEDVGWKEGMSRDCCLLQGAPSDSLLRGDSRDDEEEISDAEVKAR